MLRDFDVVPNCGGPAVGVFVWHHDAKNPRIGFLTSWSFSAYEFGTSNCGAPVWHKSAPQVALPPVFFITQFCILPLITHSSSTLIPSLSSSMERTKATSQILFCSAGDLCPVPTSLSTAAEGPTGAHLVSALPSRNNIFDTEEINYSSTSPVTGLAAYTGAARSIDSLESDAYETGFGTEVVSFDELRLSTSDPRSDITPAQIQQISKAFASGSQGGSSDTSVKLHPYSQHQLGRVVSFAGSLEDFTFNTTI
ncbi:hypothetical protein DFS34DRAFT_591059 [Phlyctochytrium arcticum]|nr:hypothetical protein DFS34DRAFT_591059 [Phlyctochytrium arcticum]